MLSKSMGSCGAGKMLIMSQLLLSCSMRASLSAWGWSQRGMGFVGISPSIVRAAQNVVSFYLVEDVWSRVGGGWPWWMMLRLAVVRDWRRNEGMHHLRGHWCNCLSYSGRRCKSQPRELASSYIELLPGWYGGGLVNVFSRGVLKFGDKNRCFPSRRYITIIMLFTSPFLGWLITKVSRPLCVLSSSTFLLCLSRSSHSSLLFSFSAASFLLLFKLSLSFFWNSTSCCFFHRCAVCNCSSCACISNPPIPSASCWGGWFSSCLTCLPSWPIAGVTYIQTLGVCPASCLESAPPARWCNRWAWNIIITIRQINITKLQQ